MFKKLILKVYCLDLKFSLSLNFSLLKLIRSINPDILQTWLITGDLIGGIAGRLSGIKIMFGMFIFLP